MKTNFPLLIVLMLAFSLANAQKAEEVNGVESAKTISVDTNVGAAISKDTLLIDASQLKSTISRTTSDIRIYLNRKRKVGNISFIFPKINKAIRA
ncbi:hypothetical protein [Cognatitamlana onchidii]|uniref:hypothetical protein n=1 Tax=Cognatitamlana onchidii TaxID=2562860 RepID=UPI0010A6A3BA|nr:hypothetical protein [Algibacter onchidii]